MTRYRNKFSYENDFDKEIEIFDKTIDEFKSGLRAPEIAIGISSYTIADIKLL